MIKGALGRRSAGDVCMQEERAKERARTVRSLKWWWLRRGRWWVENVDGGDGGATVAAVMARWR